MTSNTAGFSAQQVALVTGGSGGIGGAIATALIQMGAIVYAVGRDAARLEALRARVTGASGTVCIHRADLTRDEDVAALVTEITSSVGRLDILVHSAGGISYGRMVDCSVRQFDELYAANVRAPYLLTKQCLPLLKDTKGQIAFINSSTGLAASAGAGQFSATQHALKAIADSLRDEVNSDGVRVFSVFPGRTATARMVERFSMEGRAYNPELLLQSEDVANVVTNTLMLPRTAEVTNISIRPMAKSY